MLSRGKPWWDFEYFTMIRSVRGWKKMLEEKRVERCNYARLVHAVDWHYSSENRTNPVPQICFPSVDCHRNELESSAYLVDLGGRICLHSTDLDQQVHRQKWEYLFQTREENMNQEFLLTFTARIQVSFRSYPLILKETHQCQIVLLVWRTVQMP